MHRQVGALRKVLSQQAIGIFIRPALPRALRIAKIDVDFGRQSKATMIRKFLAPVTRLWRRRRDLPRVCEALTTRVRRSVIREQWPDVLLSVGRITSGSLRSRAKVLSVRLAGTRGGVDIDKNSH
jgi:hypothetical protein